MTIPTALLTALLLLLLAALAVPAQTVTLAWDAPPPAGGLQPDGYVLTRNGAVVQRHTGTQVADTLPGPGTYTYTVQASAQGALSAPSNALQVTVQGLPCLYTVTPGGFTLQCTTTAPSAPPGPYPLRPVGSLTVQTVDSQETGTEARLAVDGGLSTFWHTQWRLAAPPLPHTLALDLGALLWVDGLIYTPRQDGSRNGTLTSYRIETTVDGLSWTAASTGTWPLDATPKTVRFPAVAARAVRLVALVSNGTPYASAAEVGVYATDGGTP